VGHILLTAGNITLTFKTKDNAARAKIHEEWVKKIDLHVMILQHMYMVVVHNSPTGIYTDSELAWKTITSIEDQNAEVILPYMLSHVAWLNSAEMHNKSRYGPLLLCFKSKEVANKIIDSSIVLNKALCQVSIYIPRPSQCFWCQNWGHRAMECTREATCGKCASEHNTSDHKCNHSGDCSPGTKCKIDLNKCSNCGGKHPSWLCSCPTAKTALESQTSTGVQHRKI
jgi:hypothetical protein